MECLDDIDGYWFRKNGRLPWVAKFHQTISPWSSHGIGKLGCTGEGQSIDGNFRQYLILEECKRACDNTFNCNAITWNSKDNRCYLKNKQDACVDESCDWVREDATDWIYAWKTCSSISTWSTYAAGQKGCTGEGEALLDDGWTYVILEECKNICDYVSDCNSIAWNSRDNSCFLKHKKDACDDIACAWDRNDAKDWNFYWKTCENTTIATQQSIAQDNSERVNTVKMRKSCNTDTWPNVDNGVICGDCFALININSYGTCRKY